jgi:hypothetical protein
MHNETRLIDSIVRNDMRIVLAALYLGNELLRYRITLTDNGRRIITETTTDRVDAVERYNELCDEYDILGKLR